MSNATFQDLRIPFPLFQAPAREAVEYVGVGTCSLCGAQGQHAFVLGIGCALMLPCPACNLVNGLDASYRLPGACQVCAAPIPFPGMPRGDILTCYRCLRTGRAAITKDTPLGMISWEQATSGVTHGRPGLATPDFETLPLEHDWIGAKVPIPDMIELLRTPTFATIQGESWEFHCKRPMIYAGSWSREDFARHARDGNGRAHFDRIVQDSVPGLWEDRLHDETGIYVFKCSICGDLLANWDIA